MLKTELPDLLRDGGGTVHRMPIRQESSGYFILQRDIKARHQIANKAPLFHAVRERNRPSLSQS
jgi:hypothetical protein